VSAVGKPLDRVDGRLKVTGAARFAGDFWHDRMAEAVAITSTVARGKIISIDTASAKRVPGVLAIYTNENAPSLQTPRVGDAQTGGHPGELLAPLSGKEIFFAGQYVALVVAEDITHARHAASLVKVRCDEEKPEIDPLAVEGKAYPPKSFFGQPIQHSRGDVEAALATADAVRVEATYSTPFLNHNPMETHATVARWQEGRLIVEDSNQGVVGSRAVLAQVFGLPKESVRVLAPYLGGGFGCKGFQWGHSILAAMAARELGRPVRLVLTREQMFLVVGRRAQTIQRLALAAKRDGQLIAMKHATLNPTSPITEFAEPAGKTTTAMLYACENVATPQTVVRVNVGAPCPMRGPGETPGTFGLESAMDELAEALDMDPLALRIQNHADRNPETGKPWSSKYLKECYAVGSDRFGWVKRPRKVRSMRDGPLLVGWGMATAVYPANRRPASCRIRIGPDGRALIQVACQDLGTGSYTIFTQIAADALSIPVEKITFELGDSDFPEGPNSGGSASAASVSEAILKAAAEVKKALEGAGGFPPASPVEVTATTKPPDAKDNPFSNHSFGAHFCEVKIDPQLPRVRVTRWVSVIDVGRVLNHKTGRSQVLGGVTMGLGMALMEGTIYDRRTARPVNANFADYAVPVNLDVPEIDVYFIDKPDPNFGTLGCRGLGEIGITGVAAAVANAVWHATGRRVRDLPITPDKLL
jgi:xanthine dehydrogenase YagR molybdenum-binding subunit